MDHEKITKEFLRIGLYIFISLFLLFPYHSVCQEFVSQGKSVMTNPNSQEAGSTTIATLEAITQSVKKLREQIKDKENEVQAVVTEEQKGKITHEITELNIRLELLEKDFETIATGVDLEAFTKKPKDRFDWQEEIQELLGPIIREMKKATAHPREIEKLRNDLAYFKGQLPIFKKGIQKIEKHIEKTQDQELKKYLNNLKNEWVDKNKHISNQLAVVEYQLDQKLKIQKSFFQSIQDILRIFFKSRGRNLILALLVFIFVWLLFHFLYAFVNKMIPFKESKMSSLYTRVIALIYYILTFVGATGALLLVLYISGDWVLLGLAIIFLFGIAWAARQAIPRFWEQVKLMLNLGPVKEKERLVYNGLPWKVDSLNFFTRLINPELKGGMIRLPLRELRNLHSRPYHPNETWFPCKEGDWVILADRTYGKVVSQTPEMTELSLLGGSHKTYSTLEFLRQNPNNLSHNFRLNVTFGIDYQHQAISTWEVPDKLQKMLIEELSKEGYGNDIKNIGVEFKQAGTSSLDFEVLADFSGSVAGDYPFLSRAIQRICVEACNKYGWNIPFTQLTLHTANPPAKKENPLNE